MTVVSTLRTIHQKMLSKQIVEIHHAGDFRENVSKMISAHILPSGNWFIQAAFHLQSVYARKHVKPVVFFERRDKMCFLLYVSVSYV